MNERPNPRNAARAAGVFLAVGLLAGGMAQAQGNPDPAANPKPAPKSTVLLQTTTNGDGVPITYPKGTPQVTARITEIPVGVSTGVHNHPIPLFAYIMQGELTIKSTSGDVKVFKAGDAFMERTDWHEGINAGTEPVRLLAVYAGEVGAPLSNRPAP